MATWRNLTSIPVLAGTVLTATVLGLYLYTLAPTLTWGWNDSGVDGGELLAAADSLGIPHPPGYPTYMLLLKAFSLLVPVGDFAFRGNLFSAFLSAASVASLYWAGLGLSRRIQPNAPMWLAVIGALLGASVLATAPVFWSHAVMTEVYALNALFVGIALGLAIHIVMSSPQARTSPTSSHRLEIALYGLIAGVGLGNHLTLLAVIIPLSVWLGLSVGWRRLTSPWTIGAFLLGISIYLYLPIRAAQDPPLNWGSADTLEGVVWVLTARPYQDYVFGIEPETIVRRLGAWVELMFVQFNPLGLFLGLIGTSPLRARATWFFLTTLTSSIIISVYSVTYNSIDFEVLMIPAILVFSLWISVGSTTILWSVMRAAVRGDGSFFGGRITIGPVGQVILLAGLAFTLLPFTAIALNLESQDLSDDRMAYDHASNIFEQVPERAVVFAETEKDVFSLWYMGLVERPEKDVVVIAVRLLAFDWYLAHIHELYPDRIPDLSGQDLNQVFDTIVTANNGRARVYFTFINPHLLESFGLNRVGRLYEVPDLQTMRRLTPFSPKESPSPRHLLP